jgi:uncharacterized sulfatase
MRTLLAGFAITLLVLGAPLSGYSADRPNFVLIGAEDISPNLGCYGDPDAITPNLDAFAQQSARFTRAFTHAPVCAPSRSGLITGQYPTTLGSHHMRSKLTKTPPLFVDELKKAGYFVAWPGKTDFNFDLPKDWVDTTQDWTKKPEILPKDRPFFAYINYTVSHESQSRATPEKHAQNTARLKPEQRRDPAKLRLPPYYPDTPDVRNVVKQYHETITAVDYLVGDVLKLLDEQKWSENTVVIFFGDHGAGLPRFKRWPYDSGTRVPFLIRAPGFIKPGSIREDLVCFLDIAPTVLSLAKAEIPKAMQGRIILGEKTQPAPKYIVSCRDRMDEAPDRIRSLRDERYRYVRNFEPERPYFQYINYLDEMPIMKDWRRLAFEGKLNPTQKLFFSKTKPKEELYDLDKDPFEVHNLVDDPAHANRLADFREALEKWIKDTNDLGEVPEQELIRRGIVRDVLTTEYAERTKKHPSTPPVPDGK